MRFEDKKHLLNLDEMDDLHKEFVDIYNSLDNDIASYKNVMIKLQEQTKRHFSFEEILMDKYNYPRQKEHKDEHNKVLAEMGYFLSKADTKLGARMLIGYYKEKLPYWFDLHLISMDSDLSAFIKNQNSKIKTS